MMGQDLEPARSVRARGVTGQLFGAPDPEPVRCDQIAPGAFVLRGLALEDEANMMAAIQTVAERAPFRHMITPGGFRMSVAMTNCGAFGWVTDRHGYRYDDHDPESDLPWPEMPQAFLDLAARAARKAGYPGFVPDACLINRYRSGSRLSLHQDRDERDFDAPIVSASFGLPAIFLFGGDQRSAKAGRHKLFHGDVAVWGGPSRMAFHGIGPLRDGDHPLTGPFRFNLTLRKAS
jgi:alkylated DNA repair protein (DNA oxidative demethylase)